MGATEREFMPVDAADLRGGRITFNRAFERGAPPSSPAEKARRRMAITIMWTRFSRNDRSYDIDDLARDAVEGRIPWTPPGPSRWS